MAAAENAQSDANAYRPLLSGGENDDVSDDARLQPLGYRQALRRRLSALSNFAITFSVMSIITGISPMYGTGLRFGGPVSMVYGWPIVGLMSMMVGLSMAEISSAYPTPGGLYFWSAKLAGNRWGPLASWLTGWFSTFGRWADITSVDYSLAQLIQVIILLSTGGKNGGGYEASKYMVLLFHAGILFSQGLLNSLPISWIALLNQFSVAWNIFGVFILMLVIPLVAKERASAEFVFTYFNTDNGDGISCKAYIFALGLLMSQYSIGGFDTSVNMSDETKAADINGPKGIINAICLSILAGWGYIIGITFAVTDISALLSSDNDAGGYAIAQVFYSAFKSRYGSGIGGIVCLWIVVVAIFLCGMSCITSASRMTYGFSGDGAMPCSRLWKQVNKQEAPINAVWLSVVVAFLMALTSIGSDVAFDTMVSIATIGLYIAFMLPILFRVTVGRKSFVEGPFNLGQYGVVVGWIAVAWVIIITVLFSMPSSYPITFETLNYTPIAFGGLLFLTLSSWFLSARHWFRGPFDVGEIH